MGGCSRLWPDEPVDTDHCLATVGQSTATLTLEQARNASLISAVAIGRGLQPRASSIAIATTLQESGLRNLDYGDRDSLGLFQQRPSMGWGTIEQVTDPIYASNAFFDVMVTIPDWDSQDIGDVAQAVQRSGYPDAYDQHITRARTLASALTGETPAAWTCGRPSDSLADPERFMSLVQDTFASTAPLTITGATSLAATSLHGQLATPALAWALASFAISWADELGISQVTIADQQWTAISDDLADWVTIDPASGVATDIRIEF
jgi:hypothetical protein